MATEETTTATVTARCVGCGNERVIGPGEIPAGDVPMCDKCYSPMVAVSAQRGGSR